MHRGTTLDYRATRHETNSSRPHAEKEVTYGDDERTSFVLALLQWRLSPRLGVDDRVSTPLLGVQQMRKEKSTVNKHESCADRCQILEHKGYHDCSQTGRCEVLEATPKGERYAAYLDGCASWAASVTKSGDNNPDAVQLREAAALLRELSAIPDRASDNAAPQDAAIRKDAGGTVESDSRKVEPETSPVSTPAGAAPPADRGEGEPDVVEKLNYMICRIHNGHGPLALTDEIAIEIHGAMKELTTLRQRLAEMRVERDEALLCADITKTGFDKIADKCDQLGAINKALIERAAQAEALLQGARKDAERLWNLCDRAMKMMWLAIPETREPVSEASHNPITAWVSEANRILNETVSYKGKDT